MCVCMCDYLCMFVCGPVCSPLLADWPADRQGSSTESCAFWPFLQHCACVYICARVYLVQSGCLSVAERAVHACDFVVGDRFAHVALCVPVYARLSVKCVRLSQCVCFYQLQKETYILVFMFSFGSHFQYNAYFQYYSAKKKVCVILRYNNIWITFGSTICMFK